VVRRARSWFVVLLTPRAVESRWVRRELVYALTQERYDERITPILFEDCDLEQLSWILPSLQCVDCRSDANEGYRALLRPWGIAYETA
jgi:hypothetical protein